MLTTFSLQIYLAMEQREPNVELKAMTLIQEFVKKFRSIDYTLHPSDIPGESAGKGSNVAWAARKLSQKYSMEQRKDVIITGIDGTCACCGVILLQHVFPTACAYALTDLLTSMWI
jgi:hypothetical protein